MKNGLEQFKKLIRFLFIIILIAVQSGVFAHYWFENYNELILIAFAGKGNIMMIAFYAAFLAVFLYFFDGFKFGNVSVRICMRTDAERMEALGSYRNRGGFPYHCDSIRTDLQDSFKGNVPVKEV